MKNDKEILVLDNGKQGGSQALGGEDVSYSQELSYIPIYASGGFSSSTDSLSFPGLVRLLSYLALPFFVEFVGYCETRYLLEGSHSFP
jgi:hypothetical protein